MAPVTVENEVKRTLKLIKVLLLAMVLAAFSATLMRGKPEDAKKEKTACTTCYVKMASKELNDVGKCYAKKRTLSDCKGDAKPAEKK